MSLIRSKTNRDGSVISERGLDGSYQPCAGDASDQHELSGSRRGQPEATVPKDADTAVARSNCNQYFPGVCIQRKSEIISAVSEKKPQNFPRLVLKPVHESACLPCPGGDTRARSTAAAAAASADTSVVLEGQNMTPNDAVVRVCGNGVGEVYRVPRAAEGFAATTLDLCSLGNSVVKACAPFAQVFIRNTQGSSLCIGVVLGPICLEQCANCTVRIAAAQQVRLANCVNMQIQVRCITCPIVECSKDVRFDNIYETDGTVYPEESADIALFQARLRLAADNWIDLHEQQPIFIDAPLK